MRVALEVKKIFLGWYVKNSEESLIQGVRFADVIDTNDVRRSDEFKKL